MAATYAASPVEWLGSRMTGRWLRAFSTGTALMSVVLRVAVSNVRMPRSQSATRRLPCDRMYSAAMSSSSMVALRPALQQHRVLALAGRVEQRVVLHVARADLQHVGVAADKRHHLGRHHFGDGRQPGHRAGLGQQLQPGLAHALETSRARCAA